MRRVLIGVIAVLVAGLVGFALMVFGQMAVDQPLSSPVAIATVDSSPTTGLLVLPTLGPSATAMVLTTSAPADATTIARFEAALEVTATPDVGCYTQVADLTDGKTADIVLSQRSLIWYTGNVSFPVFKGEVKGRENVSVMPYFTYIAWKDAGASISDLSEIAFDIGTYTIYYPPEFKSSNIVEIIICPVE